MLNPCGIGPPTKRERERQRQREKDRDTERETKKERECQHTRDHVPKKPNGWRRELNTDLQRIGKEHTQLRKTTCGFATNNKQQHSDKDSQTERDKRDRERDRERKTTATISACFDDDLYLQGS
jgi:hypothetical protein